MIKLANWIEKGITSADYRRVESLTHPSAPQVLRFWDERSADGLRMGRDVPSRNIAGLLSNIIIFEPEAGGADFKVHLAGDLARKRFGRDITGETLAELFPGSDLPHHHCALNEVLWLSDPVMAHIRHKAGHLDVLELELFQVPVVAPNGFGRWVLSFGFYF